MEAKIKQIIDFLKSYRLTLQPPLSTDSQAYFIQKMDSTLINDMIQTSQIINDAQEEDKTKFWLYTWQTLNFRVIHDPSQESSLTKLLPKYETLCCHTLAGGKQQAKVIKCLQICYFNLVKNSYLSADEPILKAIITSSLMSLSTDHDNTHTHDIEWFIYLFQICNDKVEGFCKSLGESDPLLHQLLHFIAILLGKVIDDRSSTEMVRGHGSPIAEIREMYNKKAGAVSFKMSITDYEWIITDILPKYYMLYKESLKTGKGDDKTPIECLMSIMGILNCCIFLGGYSKHLQHLTCSKVMKIILQFLELSYLIYELFHARSKKVKIQGHLSNNLNKILQCDVSPEKSPLPLENGQLVCIIRVLSNLVHINSQAQGYFESNLQYFRMVMSLTHEHERQMTMKQWAIVFLKNVAERSEIMRGELEKLQIDIKVDPASMGQHI